MKKSPSVPVIFTARVVFQGNDDRATLAECDQGELLRDIFYRLQVVQAAMRRIERLRHTDADASER